MPRVRDMSSLITSGSSARTWAMLANPAPASSMASLQDGLALLARGEGDDAGIGRSSSQLSGDRGPTASGHPDVHERHIGLVAFGELDRLAGVLGHPNPVEGGLLPDEVDQGLTQAGVVICYEHPNAIHRQPPLPSPRSPRLCPPGGTCSGRRFSRPPSPAPLATGGTSSFGNL